MIWECSRRESLVLLYFSCLFLGLEQACWRNGIVFSAVAESPVLLLLVIMDSQEPNSDDILWSKGFAVRKRSCRLELGGLDRFILMPPCTQLSVRIRWCEAMLIETMFVHLRSRSYCFSRGLSRMLAPRSKEWVWQMYR